MKIIIRKEENEMESIYDLNDNDKVIHLKQLIHSNNFGPMIKEQRLVYKNKCLRNSHLLSYYRIKENSIILLKYQSASTSSSNSSSPSSVSDCEALDKY